MVLPFPNVEGDPLFKEINLLAFQEKGREGNKITNNFQVLTEEEAEETVTVQFMKILRMPTHWFFSFFPSTSVFSITQGTELLSSLGMSSHTFCCSCDTTVQKTHLLVEGKFSLCLKISVGQRCSSS